MSSSVAAQQTLDCIWHIQTPEHVSFSCRPVGPLPRTLAWMLDVLIRIGIIYLGAIFFFIMGGEAGFGFLLILVFFCWFLYSALLETWWRGQTIGKRALGIRVVNQAGGPPNFVACILRNFIAIADVVPGACAAGLTCMGLSPQFQRLGDLAANTMVIYSEPPIRQKISYHQDEKLLALVNHLPKGLHVRLDIEVQRAITEYMGKRHRFHPDRLDEIAQHLASPLQTLLGMASNNKPDLVLCAIYHALTNGDQAINEQGGDKRQRERWQRLAQLIETPDRQLTPKSINEISQLIRACSADLALKDAKHLSEDTIAYLNDLLGSAHRYIYRHEKRQWSELLNTFFMDVPYRLFTDWYMRIACLAFFGLFFGSAALATFYPSVASDFLGPEMLIDMETMYSSPVNERSSEYATQMAGFYILNNVGIAISCFAYGIFLGLGSLLVLIYNAFVLGLLFGHMMTVEPTIHAHFFEFVRAHGPFELTGIAIAGAAGLRLGWSLVATQGLTRLHSLQRAGRESVPIIITAGLLITLAAFIEGFISPSPLAIEIKTATMIMTSGMLIAYIIGLGMWQQQRLKKARLML